ncbi:MAG: hypothetical protein HFF80_04675 [Oscillospiraceae bacterium]|nr:hypothetical protein [Oscillospiraceae bacterium]
MRGLLPLALAACLLLCGCASLLERSYSTVEPYTNRYWDSSAEDTLRAESYQDLVNSLLMLVEQQADEGTIRCYEEANSYIQAQRARAEVRRETMLGSYLLEKLDFTYQYSASYSTLTYQMTYREDAESLASIMKISDSQSLVDLLRLAVREEHEKLTARFVYDTPRTEVTDAVEGLWLELCLGEADPAGNPADIPDPGETAEPPEDEPPAEGTDVQPELPPEEADPAMGVLAAPPPEETLPDCPWTIRFYPDQDTAEVVEILLADPPPDSLPHQDSLPGGEEFA